MRAGIRKVEFDIITNPDGCSIKRAAWAYGCSRKGSDGEKQLLDILVSKINQTEDSSVLQRKVARSIRIHQVMLRATEMAMLHGMPLVQCPVCEGTVDPQCGCDGTMPIKEAIDWHKSQLEILSK